MPEQTCKHPTDRCATCGSGAGPHVAQYPRDFHPFQPAPCGEALVRQRLIDSICERCGDEFGDHYLSPSEAPCTAISFLGPWRCPIHGEEVTYNPMED